MEKRQREELYEKAIKNWGPDAQVKMMFEEMGELAVALARFDRGRANIEDVITEIADVTIMAEQMWLIFGKEKTENEFEYKLNRLKEKLDKFEKEHGTEGKEKGVVCL
jgi:NTP pyrophosphatase (non-canonical NTP hydrolase)